MRRLLPLLLIVVLTSCKVGPNYKRPAVATPALHRGDTSPTPTPASLADTKWFDLFQDEALQGLIKEALAANYDIRIAAQRILDFEGQVTATRSRIFPQFGLASETSRTGTKAPVTSTIAGLGSASWEIDLFGRLRRATEASQAELLASKENQNFVIQSLVARVAALYFNLLDYDTELAYVKQSIITRTASARLVRARVEGGVASVLELDQAESLIASATATQAQLDRLITQTENEISFLLALIDRRPDIREAEQQLVAANARVGVAKAAFFPTIVLTAAGGYQTVDLFNVISRSGGAYSMGATVDLPIFDAGRRQGNYRSAQAQFQGVLVNYQRTIGNAFREVSDGLVGYQKAKEFRVSQEQFANTLRHQSQIAESRYRGGVASFLEVLDTERERLNAEQTLAQAQRDELVSLVTLYQALGGGWQ
jgi:multidrug efflux system outer membrane protein